MGFIAGQYTGTYGGSSLGQILDGVRTRHRVFKEIIRGDNFAQSRQDAVYQGQDLDVLFTLMEYNAAAAQAAFWPYDATIFDLGTVGVLDTSKDAALVFTAVAGTPAVATPASITFSQSILADGFDVELLFAPSLRTVPLQMSVYPNSSGVFGTVT